MSEKTEINDFLNWWGMNCEYEDLDAEQIKALKKTLAYSKYQLVKAWGKFKGEIFSKIEVKPWSR